jgi:hypothetical protein
MVLTYGPDGVLRQNNYFSTTGERRFFRGTVDSSAVDLQVSINGSGFTSDPSLITFTGTEWVVPNPSYELNGTLLLTGKNVVSVRAVLLSGSVTTSSNSTVFLVDESSVGVVASPPTAVSIEQYDQSVIISTEKLLGEGFQGFNFYASLYAGGGSAGYTRINIQTVSSGVQTSIRTPFNAVDVEASVVVDSLGNPVADPLFWRLTADQEDKNGVRLQTDLDESYEIPELARKLQLTGTLSYVEVKEIYSFQHNRLNGPLSTPPTVSVGTFSSASGETPLYYVVAAVYYDQTQNLEYVSSFSMVVIGHPLQVTTALGAFQTVTRNDIVKSFISSVYRSNPQLKVEAGSVLRDTVIDPFSTEAERIRFVLDFFQRARTPTLLLQIDDLGLQPLALEVALLVC